MDVPLIVGRHVADSAIQTYCFWVFGLWSTGADNEAIHHSSYSGFFKLVQSAGWLVGFILLPEKRASPMQQLMIAATCHIGGGVVIVSLGRKK